MSEKTFSGASRAVLDVFGPQKFGEFLEIGADVLESEDLIDLVYKVYLPLVSDGFVSANEGLPSIGAAYLGGFYLPCAKRVVLSGQIDLLNDDLPDYAGFVSIAKDCTFFSVRRISKLPNEVASIPFSKAVYACSVIFEKERIERTLRRNGMNSALNHVLGHISVMPSGNLIPCARGGHMGPQSSRGYAGFIPGFAAALNCHSDRSSLWNVKTSENLISAVSTPLVLGVNEEHVKSLFYMRSLPLTESGRKRPILHWARAHKRRIAEGIEIDVRKHLRGIERFEMEGFAFEITNPRKSARTAA